MTLNELRAQIKDVPPVLSVVTDPQTELLEAAIILDDVQHIFKLFDCKQTKDLCTIKVWNSFKSCQEDVNKFLIPWSITRGGRL